jgi:hypothetical protein
VASGSISSQRTEHIVNNAPVSRALKERFLAGFLSPEDYDRIAYEGPEELRPPDEGEVSALDGKFEYEWQIAGFGRDEPYEVDGRTTWLGREVMKNSNWQGVKELD